MSAPGARPNGEMAAISLSRIPAFFKLLKTGAKCRWYAKRFLHPSIVAPYDYIFLWDEDLGVEAFDAEEYVKILRKHGLEISQPGLDTTRGSKPFFDITVRRDGTEVHK